VEHPIPLRSKPSRAWADPPFRSKARLLDFIGTVYGSAQPESPMESGMSAPNKTTKQIRTWLRFSVALALWVGAVSAVPTFTWAQTNCAEGDGVLDTAPPKTMTPQELIQKFTAEETKVRDARSHYSYTQDVMVHTLNGTSVDGQFHEITNISYDLKGKRVENVTFAEQSTLRDISLTAQDTDDIRTFMPWILTTDQAPLYKLTYAGQQHVDDLDTYVFHVEPLKEEKDKRYFQGRVWIDSRDLQVVKLCGKSVPEQVKVKKHQPVDVRPTFVGYRQIVDGYWFPAYARVDDTLHFGVQSIHLREVVKFKDYKLGGPNTTGSKP
jgi:hypothetical protein